MVQSKEAARPGASCECIHVHPRFLGSRVMKETRIEVSAQFTGMQSSKYKTCKYGRI